MSEFEDKVVIVTGAGGGLEKRIHWNLLVEEQRSSSTTWAAAVTASDPATWQT